MKGLVEQFHEHIDRCIDAGGVYPHQAIHVKAGKYTMMALDLNDAAQVYMTIAAVMLKESPEEAVVGLDRFCKDGQGTTLGDCITAAYWDGKLWRPFIIEYQHEPRIVLPVNWDNEFWNPRILDDMRHFKLV